jgi:hypothetical protein
MRPSFCLSPDPAPSRTSSLLPNVAQDLLFNKCSFRLADSKRDPSYNNVSMIDPYSNWQGPVNTNHLYFLAFKRYGFDSEAAQLAGILGWLVLADVYKWGSMHECYHAETGRDWLPRRSNQRITRIRRLESADSRHASVRGYGRLFSSRLAGVVNEATLDVWSATLPLPD